MYPMRSWQWLPELAIIPGVYLGDERKRPGHGGCRLVLDCIFSHLLRCCMWWSTSFRHLSQNELRNCVISVQRWRKFYLLVRSIGSGGDKQDDPIRKWLGVKTAGSDGSERIGHNGLELRQASIFADSVDSSSNVSVVSPIILLSGIWSSWRRPPINLQNVELEVV